MKNVIRILVVVLIVVGGLLVLQANKATTAARSAYDLLDANMEQDTGTFTATEVHEKLGREPDMVLNPNDSIMIEHYKWSSLIRKHTLQVHYDKKAAALMTSIKLD